MMSIGAWASAITLHFFAEKPLEAMIFTLSKPREFNASRTCQIAAAAHPAAADVPRYTDKYFTRTRQIVERYGDLPVTYAVFMRRPVLYTARLALDWIEAVMAEKGAKLTVEERFEEGDWVGAGEPMIYLTGSFCALSELSYNFV